jgi:hypothetical protein
MPQLGLMIQFALNFQNCNFLLQFERGDKQNNRQYNDYQGKLKEIGDTKENFPSNFKHSSAPDCVEALYINKYVDHQSHEIAF